jgi:long-subunit acyl-CoA synthetase (AMP-forming)
MMHASGPFRTLCEAFQHTATVDPEAVALRTPGGGQSLTWREYTERVRQIAGGLATLGLARGETLALMLTNRPEFNLIDTAAMHLGVIPYSIYGTCSVPQVCYLLTNAESRVAVCERQFLDRVRAAGGPVRHIVAVDGQAADDTISLRDLESRTAGGFDFDASWRAVQPSDLLTLIYTSGTTGDPKGVELTHANVLAEAAMVIQMYGVRHGDRHISYLPAAHIADRMSAHYVQLVYGTQLTTLSNPDRLGAALREVEPDYIFAVPRVWEKFKNALDASIAGAQGPQAQAIGRAMELGYRRVRGRQAG